MSYSLDQSKIVSFALEGKDISYNVEGSCIWGENEVLLDKEDNLLKNSRFNDLGFTVDKFLEKNLYLSLNQSIKKIIFNQMQCIKKINLEYSNFDLENYHLYVSDDEHYLIIEPFRVWLDAANLGIEIEIIEKRISEILQTKVSSHVPHYNKKTFAIRIVRPNSSDFNPLHKDPWLNILKNTVNAYIPIAGSSKESSLPIMPGSHLWKESEIERTAKGAKVNGKIYTVPSVTSSCKTISMIRPNPEINELMVFSPYLIHGGGINFQKNTTRISLEMRFWRD